MLVPKSKIVLIVVTEQFKGQTPFLLLKTRKKTMLYFISDENSTHRFMLFSIRSVCNYEK